MDVDGDDDDNDADADDNDDADDGYPMVGDLVVGSGHRGTAALKLIVIYVAEIQN